MSLGSCIIAVENAFREAGLSSIKARNIISVILEQANAVSETALHSAEERLTSLAKISADAKKATGHTSFDTSTNATVNRLLKLQSKLETDALAEAARKQKSAILNTKAWVRFKSKIDHLKTGIHRNGKPVTSGEAMRYKQIGTVNRIFDAEGNIVATRGGEAGEQVALRHKYLQQLATDLESQKLQKVFKSGVFDKEISLERWHMETFGEMRQQTPNDAAFKMAQIIYKIEQDMSLRENEAGGMSRLNGQTGIRQTHNRDRILKGTKTLDEAYQRWKDVILPKLDRAKTFEFVVNEDIRLRQWFDNIISNEHGVDNKVPTGAEVGYARPGSLVKRRSAHEEMFFKSGQDAWDYNQEFGTSNIRQATLGEISRTSRDIVMLENYGTDPDRMFRMQMDFLSKHDRTFAKTASEATSTRNNMMFDPEAIFKSMMGYLDAPPTGKATYVHRWMRNYQSVVALSKLGAGFLSAIPDVAFVNSTLRYNGISEFDALTTGTKGIADFLGLGGQPKESQIMAMRAIGVGLDSFAGEMNTRVAFGDAPGPGLISSTQQLLFKLNGMHRWNDSFKRAVGMTLSNQYGQNYKTRWDALPKQMKDVMQMYGFREEGWKSIRQAAIVTAPDGTKFLDPAGMQNLSTAQTMKHFLPGEIETPGNLARKRNELEVMLRSMINDQVDDAVITPGTKERVVATLGTQAGTPAGILARMLTHFKSFPISVVTRVLNRDLNGADTLGKGIMASARTIAMATAGGYMSMAIKDAIKGKKPRSFMKRDGSFNHDVLRDSFLRGGAGGLYGDVLFTEYDRAFNDPASVLSGPSVGTAFDVFALGTRTATGLITGEDTPAGSEYLATTVNNLPMANLYYLRPVVDYLIMNQLNELLDPGYTRGLKRKARKHEQEYFAGPGNIWDN